MEKLWKILGITETKDLDLLKNAYREKLVLVNLEDDPEGFKALRNAYEEAVRRAKTEESLVPKDQSFLGNWISQVEEVYSCFSKRISKAYWKELLEDDICMGLDTTNQARDGLLEFLMSHFRLPYEIWILIDQQFHLVEDKKELYEHYPKNFLDYMYNNVAYTTFLDYQLFEGEEYGSYDEFIDQFFQLRSLQEEGKESPLPAIETLREFDVYHPYLDMEYIRFQVTKENWHEAKEALEPLTRKYPEDLYILLYKAKIHWGMEEYDEAYENYSKIIDRNPDYYSAKVGMADYYQQVGKYEDAKELYLDLLDYDSQNAYLLEQMRAVNKKLIIAFQNKMEHDPKDMESALELGWCYFQNEKFQRVIELLDQLLPDEENYFQYHNLKGRTYLILKEYEKALDHLKKWLEEIKKLKEDGTDKTSKRIKRLGYAYYTLYSAYSNLSDKNTEHNKVAMEYLEKALEVEHSLGSRLMYLQAKARLHFKMQEYQKCVDVCHELVEKDSNYYPAYVTRQEAYYQLEYYKNVIEDYFHAIEIYPHHIAPYKWAMKTYWLFRDYEEGMKVINRAEEYKLQSNEMTLYKIRFLRCLAKTKEETAAVLSLCKELEMQIKNDNKDLDEESEVYFEIGLCSMDMRQYYEALNEINRAIDLDSTKDNYHYVKGNIYMELEKYDDAIKIYIVLNTNKPDNSSILFRIGEALQKKGNTDEAIIYYEKALNADSEHRTANHELMEIYEDRWENQENIEFYEKAIFHATKQLEITPTDYYYIERGLLYLNNDAFKEAEEDFLKAASYNEENLFAYNNLGMVCRNQGDYEKAIEWFKKAIEKLDFDKTLLPYSNLGKCYESLQQYQQALRCYQENLKLFPQKASVIASIAEVLKTMQRYDEALDYLKKGLDAPDANELYFILHMGEIYEEQGLGKKAVAYYKEALKKDPKSKGAFERLGDYYYFIKGKNKKALKYYISGLDVVEDHGDSYYRDFCFDLGRLWIDLKRKDKAIQYFNKTLESYKQVYGSIDSYLSHKGHQISRCYRIGRIYYYLGEIQKAKEYFNKMSTFRMCNKCTFTDCYEILEAKAMMFEANGDISSALIYYEKAEKISRSNQFAAKKIRELKKKRRLDSVKKRFHNPN